MSIIGHRRIALVSAIGLTTNIYLTLRTRELDEAINLIPDNKKSFKKRNKFDQLEQSNRDKGFR